MKKILLLIAITLFLNSVLALSIETEIDSNVIVKEFNNPINAKVKIKNASSGTYNFYTLADLSLIPRATFEMINEGNVEKELTFTPTENLKETGLYKFTYTLNHRGIEKVDEKLTINLVNLKDILEIESDYTDPTSGQIKFKIVNKENVKIENLSTKFTSILFEAEKDLTFDPYEEEEIIVNVEEETLKKTKAGVYILNTEFKTPKGKVEISGNIYLGEKKGITTTEDSSGFLVHTKTISKINTGNVLEDVTINTEKNIFTRLFTTFSIEPEKTERSGFSVSYTWTKKELEPTEVFTVKTKTNYLYPLLILILAIIVVVGVKRYTETKLEIKKTVHPVRTKNDEFALRIKLRLKARQEVENVTLTDRVPAIVKVYKKFGSTKPDKIDSRTRKIQWNIGDLQAGEERMYSYIVYSKVGVVGKFSLPEATAIFEKGEKINETKSNKVFFLNDQTNTED